MGYLPIFIDVGGRRCTVIGGGDVAERKACSLIDASAAVTVVSPALTTAMVAMAQQGAIRHLARPYRKGDLEGAFLAYEASGNTETARAVSSEARERGVLLNVADAPDLCTFIAPAIVKRGDLQIAISTGGASPAFARKIREELEEHFGPEYELVIDLLATARRWLRAHDDHLASRSSRLTALVRSDLRECLRVGDFNAADATLNRILGTTFDELGFDPAQRAGQTDSTPLENSRRSGHPR
jgi:precorrin-2 dehydrogenase/sirohydrochlorin ferrochelatase